MLCCCCDHLRRREVQTYLLSVMCSMSSESAVVMVRRPGCIAFRGRTRSSRRGGLIADDVDRDPENNVYRGRIQLTRVDASNLMDQVFTQRTTETKSVELKKYRKNIFKRPFRPASPPQNLNLRKYLFQFLVSF